MVLANVSIAAAAVFDCLAAGLHIGWSCAGSLGENLEVPVVTAAELVFFLRRGDERFAGDDTPGAGGKSV